MTQPTHTHRESGGKFAELQQHMGTGPLLEGHWLIVYEDLDKTAPCAWAAVTTTSRATKTAPVGTATGWERYG